MTHPKDIIHLQVSATAVRCAWPMRTAEQPDGWDLGNVTVDIGVTCENCLTGRHYATNTAGRRALTPSWYEGCDPRAADCTNTAHSSLDCFPKHVSLVYPEGDPGSFAEWLDDMASLYVKKCKGCTKMLLRSDPDLCEPCDLNHSHYANLLGRRR